MDQAEFTPLLEAARAGAEWAWSRLYADLSGPVLGYLRTRGSAEPEDQLGEVFVQVARNAASFEGDYPAFRSWVFTIAYHRLVDERRYRARRPVTPGEIPDTARGTGDAEAEALAGLATAEVVALLGTLTPEQRDVLLLRIVGDLSLEEVARIMGRRPGAVKALQRRGLEALRRTLAPVSSPGSPSVTRA
ncbi:MAG: sigma-70 family RNA polymerase sigma factor [Acidimicrobiia bacterium]|nr:sigma-70 family RNA polymerase sigma factor [Acidimicrobiia bacterium]